MDVGSIIWLTSPLVAYIAVIAVGAWSLRGTRVRQLRSAAPQRHRILVAAYLALVFTPSVITDFFLFMIPGPALLGFLFLIPGTLVHMFSDSAIVVSFLYATSLYHLLPLLGGFAVAYGILWARDRYRPVRVAQSV